MNLAIISGFFAILAFFIGGAAIIVTYRRYQYSGHFWFFIGFTLLCASMLTRLILEFTTENVALNLWILANCLLIFGLWFIIMAVILGQYGRIPTSVHFLSLLFGFGLGINMMPGFLEVTKVGGSYNAIYRSDFPIITSFLFILAFLIVLIRPLLLKIRQNPSILKARDVSIILLAYILLLVWIGSAGFNVDPFVRGFRLFLFALMIVILALAISINPLSLIITPEEIRKFVIVDNKTKLPIIAYDVSEESAIDMDLITALISAVKSGLESLVLGKTVLKIMMFEDSVINYIAGNLITLIFVTSNPTPSSNLELLARIFLKRTEDHYIFSKHGLLIEKKEYHSLAKELLRILKGSTLT